MADRLCDCCAQLASGCPALQARVELPNHDGTLTECKEFGREVICNAVQRSWEEKLQKLSSLGD